MGAEMYEAALGEKYVAPLGETETMKLDVQLNLAGSYV
jgi:hypothetical protein